MFDEDIDQKFGLWSAVIEFIELSNEERKANAKIYFLFSENIQFPGHLLIEGHTFKLINKRIIAIGKITVKVF